MGNHLVLTYIFRKSSNQLEMILESFDSMAFHCAETLSAQEWNRFLARNIPSAAGSGFKLFLDRRHSCGVQRIFRCIYKPPESTLLWANQYRF